MKQEEAALIMLLVGNINGVPSVLLSFRSEPGLIGTTNLTTTIQSTPSNFLQKHGGKSTPFIEIAMNPTSFGEKIYDGEHYDWGDYYILKHKQFLIINLNSPLSIPVNGFIWVDLNTAQRLCLEDHLITSDLRVTLGLLFNKKKAININRAKTKNMTKIPQLQKVPFFIDSIDDNGTRVGFFKTYTKTREVSSWKQPLLIPNKPMEIRLISSTKNDNEVFAVELKSQPGLLGLNLFFPAEVKAEKIIKKVKTSAEGGRFWKYPINITWLETNVQVAFINDLESSIEWLTQDELSVLIATSKYTSLELRMAWSLVIGKEIL